MPVVDLRNFDPVILAVGKAVCMYLLALVGLRLGYRKTLSQWSAIDFAAAVAVGAIIGRTAVAESQSFAVGVAALAALFAAHGCVTVMRRHPRVTAVVDHPVRILMANGRMRPEQLLRCGITKRDLSARLRQQGIYASNQVRYVLYEATGQLTVVPMTVRGEGDLLHDGVDLGSSQ